MIARKSPCLLFCVLLTLGMCLSGCAALGWMVAQFAPPQDVDAIYKPPKGKKILVFVDDIAMATPYEPLREELMRDLNKQLLAHKIAREVVPYGDLINLIAITPNFNDLHIPTVGKKLGADLVLYVLIEDFSVRDPEGSTLWKGNLVTSVKFVDATGRIWPKDRNSYPIEPITRQLEDNSSPTYGVQITKYLAAMAADKIAKCFYDHEEPVKITDTK